MLHQSPGRFDCVNAWASTVLAKSTVTRQSFPAEHIGSRILAIRGQRVMLDSVLALLYAVTTGALIQAVQRNRRRFPPDFMFQLTKHEVANLKSQTVISSSEGFAKWGGRRKPPHAFTEQGVAMLSSVLRSDHAIAANIAIMRAFVRLREMVSAHAELANKLDELEHRVSGHDEAITKIVQAIRELAAPPPAKPGRSIGFVP